MILNSDDRHKKADDMLARISVDPAVCFGTPCIRGTRIWVSTVLDNLAAGSSEAELLKAYPQLQLDDVRAALRYAALIAHENVIPEAVSGPN